jgi:stage V sporulation protein SpoVS
MDARLLLLATTCAAAFVRDRGEHATIGQACVTAAIEAIAVVTCYLVLGPALGLWRRTTSAAG